jgi:hypothetical protein
MTTAMIEATYGIGADVFDILKTHEPYDASEVCGNCGETSETFDAVIGEDGGWITLCPECVKEARP